MVSVAGSTVSAWVNPGTFDLGRPIDTGVSFRGADWILDVGDWDRDGYGDGHPPGVRPPRALARRRARPPRARQVLATGFGSIGRLAAVGDMTGDGYPDLMGQPSGGVMTIYPGRGLAGLRKSYPAYGSIRSGTQIGIGRWNTDGAPDSLIRRGGSLTLYPATAPAASRRRRALIDLSPTTG